MNITNQVPTDGYLRLFHIIGDKKANPPVQPLIPVSSSHWYDGIQKGIFPAPKHIGRLSVWRIEDIRRLIEQIDAGELGEINS